MQRATFVQCASQNGIPTDARPRTARRFLRQIFPIDFLFHDKKLRAIRGVATTPRKFIRAKSSASRFRVMTQQKEIISTINSLIETLKDGQEGFRQAAEAVKDSELKSLFSEYSLQRSQFCR